MLEAAAPELPAGVPTSALVPSSGPVFWVLGTARRLNRHVSALQPAGVAAARVQVFSWSQSNAIVPSPKVPLGVERLKKPLLGSSLSGGAWQRGTFVTFRGW